SERSSRGRYAAAARSDTPGCAVAGARGALWYPLSVTYTGARPVPRRTRRICASSASRVGGSPAGYQWTFATSSAERRSPSLDQSDASIRLGPTIGTFGADGSPLTRSPRRL